MAFPRPPKSLPSPSLGDAPDFTNMRAEIHSHAAHTRQPMRYMSQRHESDSSEDEGDASDGSSLLFGSDEDEDAFMTAVTSPTTMSRSNTELLECLGRDAVSLLAQLDCERASSPSTARRVTGAITTRTEDRNDLAERKPVKVDHSNDADDWSSISSASSQSSLFHLAPRKRKLLRGTRALAVTTDAMYAAQGTDKVAPSTSFTRTDIADLDIQAILESYGHPSPSKGTLAEADPLAPFSFGVSASLLPPASRPEPRTPRANRASPSPRTRASPRSRSGPVVRRQIVFGATAAPASLAPGSPRRVVRRQQSVADLPYNDLFSSHARVSPFPTRKKSTGTLDDKAAQHAQRPPPLPPMPFGYAPLITSSPEILRTIPSVHTRSRQNAAPSDSSSSSRYSYQSSAPSSSGHDSFRWSTTSGSTAPTIGEDREWDSSRRGSLADSATSSCHGGSTDVFLSRRPSTSTKARSVKSNGSIKSKTSVAAARRARARQDNGELIDWTTFADELVNAELDSDATAASKSAIAALNDDEAEERLGSRHVKQTMADDDPETMLEMLASGSAVTAFGGHRRVTAKLSSKSLRNRTALTPARSAEGPFPTTLQSSTTQRATSVRSAKSSSSSSSTASSSFASHLLLPPALGQKKKSLLSLRSLRSNATLRASAQQQQHIVPPVPSLPNSRKAP
ncbi:hypothetical protein OIV83_004911 [Microbotryomycetes sp. JL201]|nr:hypothetical protein OIV83_004911 [Microbotryomycetes sp. JL201]